MQTIKSLGLVLTLILCGCGTGGVGPTTPVEQKPKTKETPVNIEPKIADTHWEFGWQLLNRLDDSEKNNLFMSPLSASLALAMVLNGAHGDTYKQIATTLRYNHLPIEPINRQSAQLLQILRTPDPKAKVEIANGLWVAEGFPIEAEFVRRLQQFYGATAENLDFLHQPEESAKRINAWVKEQTHDLIEKLFEEDAFNNMDTVAVLVNTLYFKGKWQKPFAKEATHEQPFHREDGTTKPVPMMMASGNYPYYKGEGFQAVALPYGEGNLQFYLLLPDEGRTVADLRKRLNAERWKQMVAGMKPTEGEVGLPRFRIESAYQLKEALMKMGMRNPFTPGEADFSGMNREHGRKIYINSVIQKAVVQVDEEGTEAAAATGVEMRVTAVPTNAFSVVANRPFLFAIVHTPTGTVLFAGIVREPY